MERLLSTLIGRRIEIICGVSSGFTGKLDAVEAEFLKLIDDDDKVFYIGLASVIAVSEVNDAHSRPGFIG